MSNKITVGKIVANATDTAWSQAYHAGGFTAVVSIQAEKKEEADETESSLHKHGKELLDTLVSEYFTLTSKDLDTVKQAVVATVDKAPKDMQVTLIVAAVVKNVLYVVIANEGKVLLKRGDKLGMLLAVGHEDSEKIASVSGFLEQGDVVLLYTAGFGRVFPHDELAAAFDNKSAEELAEFFAPKVHGGENGDASALVFSYHEDEAASLEKPVESEKSHEPLPAHVPPEQVFAEKDKDLPGFEKPLTPSSPKLSFSHRQKLFLTIAVLLGLVMIGSIVIFQVRQNQAKQQALFQSLYMPAKTKYDEAVNLLDLNKSLAIEDLQTAQSQLTSAKSKFPSDSSEEKQINTLLSLVTKSLEDAKKVPLLTAQKASDTASPLLHFAIKHDSAYIAQDDSSFYTADATGVTQYNKKTLTSKQVIKNDGDWKSVGGLGAYLGNIYLLDTKGGILKYVSGTAKANYFADGVSPTLTNVVSLTIDGSIWTLSSDGSVAKYTKGKPDSLTVSGLDKSLSSPIDIVTTVDFDNVYILDKGNGRVVVLKKDGSFVAQYASDTARTSSHIDVSEKDKKIYLLSSGTVYQLDLK